MEILDCEQNTEEWYQARMGKPTASSFNKIITTKGVRAKPRAKYMYQLAGEIVRGEPKEGYNNLHMDRGHENEDKSRKWYEWQNDVTIEQPGFCFFDDKKEFGCSPDGLIGENGGFETKDHIPEVQFDLLENGASDAMHWQQIQGCLYVTGREWWDLVHFCEGLQPIVKRFYRDEKFIKILAIEIRMFINDLNELVLKYSA